MTTYSKKYFNTATQKWEPLLATEARSAYEIAVENGYEGTEEEFNKALGTVGSVDLAIDDTPTTNSKNLVYSGGVKSALNELETKIDNLETPTVDLTDYYTKTESNNRFQPKGNYLTSIPSEYITESELDSKLNEIVPPDVDLSNYYTKQEIEDKNYLIEVPEEYATKDDVAEAVSQIDTSTYLTKTEAQQTYQKILKNTDPLFRLNGEQVLYGSDIIIDGSGDVTIEATETLTLFAYTSTDGSKANKPVGGSVSKTASGYVITYPDGWYDSEWAQNELETYPDKTIWYSYATFAINGMPPIVDWSYPLHYAKDGKPGEDGASIEYVYYLQTGKSKVWNGDTSLPSNDWAYDSPIAPWTDNPTGVDIDNQTEWTCVRTKAPGASTWGPWSSPSLWSVFGEEGKDGPGLEYIFKLTSAFEAPIEVTYLDAVQEDDYVPDGWSDNNLSVNTIDLYLWCSIRRKKDGVWGKFEKPSCWARYAKDGLDGVAGDRGPSGIPAIEWRPFYCLGVAKDTTLAEVDPDRFSNINRSYLGIDPTSLTSVNLHEIENSNWYELPVATDETLPYLYVTQAKIVRDSETGEESLEEGSSWCEPFMLTGEHGKDGIIVTVVDVIEYYLATDEESDVVFDKNTWTAVSSKNSNKVPVTSSSNPYLWNVECVVYSDNTETYTNPVRIGNYSKDGKGIADIKEFYVLTSAAHTLDIKAPSYNGYSWNYNFTVSDTTYTWESYEYEKHQPTQELPCLWNVEIIFYDDDTYHITTPAMIGQALNAEDLAGKPGPIAYPAGIYDATKVYTATDKKAPYVYDAASDKYYVLAVSGEWLGTRDGSGGSLEDDSSNLNFPWIEIEQFDALYAKLGIIANGLIGEAVFNGNYIFSQDGKLNGKDSTSYETFDGKNTANAIFNGEAVTDFVPNMLFDMGTGRAWFGTGETLIYEDGSIVTRHLATKYSEVSELDTTLITSLLTTFAQNSCKVIFETGHHIELDLKDTSINQPGVWYEGEIIPTGCDETALMIYINPDKYDIQSAGYTVSRAADNCFALSGGHPFRFLFKWDGKDPNNITGDIIVVEPYYRDQVLQTHSGDTLYYGESQEITDIIVNQYNSDKVIVCPANCSITFNNSAYKLEGNVSVVQGTETQYKAYALHYVRDEIILVNCSLYG